MARDRGSKFAKYLYARTDEHGRERITHTWNGGGTFPPGTTRTAAKKWLTQESAKKDQGHQLVRTSVALSEAGEAFLAECHAEVAAGTKAIGTIADNYEPRWRRYIEPKLGHKKLDTITEHDVLALIRGLLANGKGPGKGVQPATAHGVETVLRSIFRFARQKRWTNNDPFAHIPVRDLPRSLVVLKEKRAPTMEEVNMLVAGLTDYMRPIVILLAFTGMRVSECLGLTWSDVELWTDEETKERTGAFKIDLQAARSQGIDYARDERAELKTMASKRRNYILPEIVRALDRQRPIEWAKGLGREDDPLFTTPNGELVNRSSVTNAVVRTAARLGMRHLTLKDMRVAIVTEMVANDVPIQVIARQTGHSEAVLRKHYLALSEEQVLAQSRRAFLALRAGGWRLELDEDLKPVAK